MNRLTSLAVPVLLLLAVSTPRLFAADGAPYSIEYIRSQDGPSPFAAERINDSQQVIGTAFVSFSEYIIPIGFLWDPVNGVSYPVTGWFGASARYLDINEAGQVAGYIEASGNAYPFVWDESTGARQFLTPGDFWPLVVRTLAMNDSGQVVGTVADTTLTDSFDRFGFYWDPDTGPVELPDFLRAMDINDDGLIVGQSSDTATALLMDADGNLTDLGTLPGDEESIAHDVNEWGLVVGTSCGPDDSAAFAWYAGTMVPIDPDGQFVRTEAHAVNDFGQVVGLAVRPDGSSTGFLWEEGVLWTLEELLDAESGAVMFAAFHDINNDGDIAGAGLVGSQFGGFALFRGTAPLPPPAPVPPPPPPVPTLSIDDVSVVEGRSGTRYAQFSVTLSSPSSDTVTVAYATADGTARVSNKDYVRTSGTLTFNPGQTSRTISVGVKGDRNVESDETFFVDLSNPAQAVLLKSQGMGTIVNDDVGRTRRR